MGPGVGATADGVSRFISKHQVLGDRDFEGCAVAAGKCDGVCAELISHRCQPRDKSLLQVLFLPVADSPLGTNFPV